MRGGQENHSDNTIHSWRSSSLSLSFFVSIKTRISELEGTWLERLTTNIIICIISGNILYLVLYFICGVQFLFFYVSYEYFHKIWGRLNPEFGPRCHLKVEVYKIIFPLLFLKIYTYNIQIRKEIKENIL